MIKIETTDTDGVLQLSITQSNPPTIEEIYPGFSLAFKQEAVANANHRLRTAKKIVCVWGRRPGWDAWLQCGHANPSLRTFLTLAVLRMLLCGWMIRSLIRGGIMHLRGVVLNDRPYLHHVDGVDRHF